MILDIQRSSDSRLFRIDENGKHRQRWRVYVDGIEVPGVQYANTRTGKVITACPFFDADSATLRRFRRPLGERRIAPRMKFVGGDHLRNVEWPDGWKMERPDLDRPLRRILHGNVTLVEIP